MQKDKPQFDFVLFISIALFADNSSGIIIGVNIYIKITKIIKINIRIGNNDKMGKAF